jgi:hypothetical protein
VERAIAAAADAGIELSVVNEPTPGKCFALNTALATVRTPYVITVDADTLVHPQAVRRLMSRLLTGPGHVVAVASTVLVRNSRVNLLTRMQEWDYWVGIAAVKRMQGMYSSTLVAQGAFSVYETAAVREIGGWPDAIGEDIVVTWRIMSEGARVLFEPTAVAFTDVPVDLRHFMLQRSRWARGMFEGLRAVPPWRQKSTRAKLMAGVDLLVPFLDIGYLLLIPGHPVTLAFRCWYRCGLCRAAGHLPDVRDHATLPVQPSLCPTWTAGAQERVRLRLFPGVLSGDLLHLVADRLSAGGHPPKSTMEVAAGDERRPSAGRRCTRIPGRGARSGGDRSQTIACSARAIVPLPRLRWTGRGGC